MSKHYREPTVPTTNPRTKEPQTNSTSFVILPGEARVTPRWKGTSYYRRTLVASESLTVRIVDRTTEQGNQEFATLWNQSKGDPNARAPYQPPIVRGRLCT